MMTRKRTLVGLMTFVILLSAWVLNVSRVGSHVEGCPEDCAAVGMRGEGPLRVMSLNVLHGFPDFEELPERLDRIAEEIRRQDADVVLLQEVPWTSRLGNGAGYLSDRSGLNYLYLRANGNRWTIMFEEGEAILSRYPLLDAAFVELKPRAGFFEHRVVLSAKVATPWGEVSFFVTHLTNGEQEINRLQAAHLLEFVEVSGEGVRIIAGDFNAVESSIQIMGLTRLWVDTYHDANLIDDGFTCCIDDLAHGPDEALEKRIDYIFLATGEGHYARVVDSKRVLHQPFRYGDGWLWASDHIGLLTTIELDQ